MILIRKLTDQIWITLFVFLNVSKMSTHPTTRYITVTDLETNSSVPIDSFCHLVKQFVTNMYELMNYHDWVELFRWKARIFGCGHQVSQINQLIKQPNFLVHIYAFWDSVIEPEKITFRFHFNVKDTKTLKTFMLSFGKDVYSIRGFSKQPQPEFSDCQQDFGF